MLNGHRFHSTGILLAVFLIIPYLFPHLPSFLLRVEAASPPVQAENVQTKKGIVTGKAEKSLAIQEGSSTIQVAVTETTQVTGQRGAFGKIAIGDIVRVDGRMTADRHLLAGRIEVLFAAGITVGPQSRSSPLISLLSVFVNGGVSVPLP